MNYTVIIHEPVPEDMHDKLEQSLVENLKLSSASAKKLVNRRSGRILKPTTQEKAEKLFNLFKAVNANVELIKIEEDLGSGLGLVDDNSFPALGVDSGPDPFADFDSPALSLMSDNLFDQIESQDQQKSTKNKTDNNEDLLAAELAQLKNKNTAEDDPWVDFASGLSGTDSEEDDPWKIFAEDLKMDSTPTSDSFGVMEEEAPPLVDNIYDIDESFTPVSYDKGERKELAQEFVKGILMPFAAITLVMILIVFILAPTGTKIKILIPVLIVMLGGAGIIYYVINQMVNELLVKPINHLLDSAKKISDGAMEESIKSSTNNEIGDLSDALDKMRVALNNALKRMRARK